MPEDLFSSRYREDFTLANGLVFRIRAVRPTDDQKLLAGFRQLSQESRYRRFLVHKNRLSAQEVRFFTQFDGVNHFALGAIELDSRGKELGGIGVARFVRAPDDMAVAEVALAVIDARQGLGIGGILLTRLLAAAAKRDIQRARFYFLADNEPIRRLLKRRFGEVTLSPDGPLVTGDFMLPACPRTEARAEPSTAWRLPWLMAQAGVWVPIQIGIAAMEMTLRSFPWPTCRLSSV